MADLCDVASVRLFLQKPDGDQEQDAILGFLISHASAAIERHTRREFTPSTAQTRTFIWQHGTLIDLAPYDLRTVTSLRLDPDTTALTLTGTSYRLRPKPNPDGTYQWVKMIDQSRYTTTYFEREVEITGDWGFASVPADVEQACVVTVADWFRERVAAFGTRFNETTGQFEVPEALPRGATALLAPYKRIAT